MTAIAVSLAGVSAGNAALPYLISRKIMRLELQLANAMHFHLCSNIRDKAGMRGSQ